VVGNPLEDLAKDRVTLIAGPTAGLPPSDFSIFPVCVAASCMVEVTAAGAAFLRAERRQD
jgi:hypothetical protein